MSHLILDLPIPEKCLTLIPDAKTRLGINIAMSPVDAIFKHTPVLFHLKKTKKNELRLQRSLLGGGKKNIYIATKKKLCYTHRNTVSKGMQILQHALCSAAGQWHYPLQESVKARNH